MAGGDMQPDVAYEPYKQYPGLPGGQFFPQLFSALAPKSENDPAGQLQLMGLVGPTSASQTLLRQSQDRLHLEQMQQAFLRDRPALLSLAETAVPSLTGQAFGPAEREHASAALKTLSPVLGSLLANPQIARQYEGLVGGSSHVPIAAAVSLAGRTSFDPASGLRGLSADTVQKVSTRLHEQLFGGTGDPLRLRTGGLGSSDTGEVIKSMMLHGQLGGLSQAVGDQSQDQVTEADLQRWKRGIQKHTRMIGVMKEIFGDAGQPNAPVAQLRAALESFAGGTQQVDASRAEMTVRTLQHGLRATGLRLEDSLLMLQGAQATTQALGINRAFAPQMVLGGLGTLGALQTTGALENPMWGLSSGMELMLKSQRLAGQAAASQVSNRLGLLERLSRRGDALGGDLNLALENARAGNFTPELEAALELSDAEFLEKLSQGSGLSRSELAREMRLTERNSESFYRAGMIDVAQKSQIMDLRKVLQMEGFNEAAASLVTETGYSGAGRGRLMRLLSQTGSAAVAHMSQERRADPIVRNALTAAAMREALAAEGPEGQRLLAMLDKQQGGSQQALVRLAEQGFGLAEASRADLPDLLALSDPVMAAARAEHSAQSEMGAFLDAVLMGKATPGMLERLADSVREMDPDKSLSENLSKLLGTVGVETTGAVGKRIAGEFERLLSAQGAMQADLDQLDQEKQDLAKKGLPAAELEKQFEAIEVRRQKILQQQSRLEKRAGMISQLISENEPMADSVRASLKEQKEGLQQAGASGEAAAAGDKGAMMFEVKQLILNVGDEAVIDSRNVKASTDTRGSAN